MRELYSVGLGIWDLSPETLLLQIGKISPRSLTPAEQDGEEIAQTAGL